MFPGVESNFVRIVLPAAFVGKLLQCEQFLAFVRLDDGQQVVSRFLWPTPMTIRRKYDVATVS